MIEIFLRISLELREGVEQGQGLAGLPAKLAVAAHIDTKIIGARSGFSR